MTLRLIELPENIVVVGNATVPTPFVTSETVCLNVVLASLGSNAVTSKRLNLPSEAAYLYVSPSLLPNNILWLRLSP